MEVRLNVVFNSLFIILLILFVVSSQWDMLWSGAIQVLRNALGGIQISTD